MEICLSTGIPPFPANLPSALCGPQVNGTQPTADYENWGQLNPCPLNACCDVFGQCGITAEFCTEGLAATGAPGTHSPGTNGCISNCGTDIVNQVAPASFERVGYYESWESSRPCQHMLPSQIDTSYYTKVHFAFGNISSDYDAVVTASDEVWQDFLGLTGVKRILSFGGWAFSTDPSTGPIFSDSVTPANRQLFAKNVVQFMTNNNLDGLDFDWEYPGGTGLPGYPIGSPDDGANYFEFLQEVRAILPEGKTLSIAAPASYWYLREFPIGNLSKVLDYFVFETYDFHGQWDYGNQYSDDSCPAGNCLQSQVNWTDTLSALSMITKAGASTNQIMLGMAMYGRSFEMTDPTCHTELCTYTGPASGATPGQCTGTAGILSNWEIQQIISNSSNSVQQYHTDEGDVLVYNSNQWVSWMDHGTYDQRSAEAQSMSLGGTSDWAIDLNVSLSAPATSSPTPFNPTEEQIQQALSSVDQISAFGCTNSAKHPDDSPGWQACYNAAQSIISAGHTVSNSPLVGNSGCYTAATSGGSCGVALCGATGAYSASLVGYAAQLIGNICDTGYKSTDYTSGQMVFNEVGGGTFGIILYNIFYQPNGPGNSTWQDYQNGPGVKKRLNIEGSSAAIQPLSPRELTKRAQVPSMQVPSYNYIWVVSAGLGNLPVPFASVVSNNVLNNLQTDIGAGLNTATGNAYVALSNTVVVTYILNIAGYDQNPTGNGVVPLQNYLQSGQGIRRALVLSTAVQTLQLLWAANGFAANMFFQLFPCDANGVYDATSEPIFNAVGGWSVFGAIFGGTNGAN